MTGSVFIMVLGFPSGNKIRGQIRKFVEKFMYTEIETKNERKYKEIRKLKPQTDSV